ncbi:MAG: PAS domain-containing protein, partial [candidate division WOR-3 bacterium]|nr:PAS domain-containing protein [candidate division WOR-3 bacterium]
MEDKYSDFLLLLDIEKIDYIVTDSDFSIIEDHSRDSAALKNVSKKTLKELSAQEAAGTAYTAELSLFVFKEKTACVFVDNSSLTSGFSNYLFIISSMLRTIDESVLILDSENRIEFINHSFRDNYDYSIDEIRDMLITEIVNPQYIEQILGILKSKTETTVEAEIYSNAGKSLPVIIDICALGSKKLILVKDKQEEEIYSREIEGLKRMQKMVFDSIGQGILVLDRNGGVLQFNQFMEQKYRFTRSKMIGRNIFDIVTDLSELKPVFRDVVEDKKVKKVTNMKRFSHRLNEELVQNFYGYPLIENNEAVGVVVVIEDLTEKKQLEDEYESTRKRNEMINALNMILSRGLQIDFVLKEIGDYILSRTSAERITVYDKQQSKFIELKKSKDRVTHRVLPDSRGMLSAVSKVSDEIHIVRKKERIVEITGRKTPAELCVFPLYFNDNLLSYFILESNKKGSFENQMEFLSGIKEYAVHIIDKAIIYEEKLSNLQKLELTLKISRLLSRTKEPKKAFEGLITILSSQINADNALLMIKSE